LNLSPLRPEYVKAANKLLTVNKKRSKFLISLDFWKLIAML
jgi:hypothetical protein